MAAKKKNIEIENEVLNEEVEVAEPVEEPKAPTKAKASKREEKVKIMVPYIEGEEPEITVGINGKFTKIRRGVEVEVPWYVAELLKNSNRQMMAALDQQKKFENQEFDW